MEWNKFAKGKNSTNDPALKIGKISLYIQYICSVGMLPILLSSSLNCLNFFPAQIFNVFPTKTAAVHITEFIFKHFLKECTECTESVDMSMFIKCAALDGRRGLDSCIWSWIWTRGIFLYPIPEIDLLSWITSVHPKTQEPNSPILKSLCKPCCSGHVFRTFPSRPIATARAYPRAKR